MSSNKTNMWKLVLDLLMLAGASTSMYYILSTMLSQNGKPFQSDEAKKRAKSSLKRLELANPDATLDLDEYEQLMLSNVIGPSEINVGFEDIGGLDDIIEDLRESVLYPLTEPDLYAGHSELLKAPKGVLLYGPPGCGKTMMAKALASQSGANFINIKMSSIMDKWFGESNKIVAAIFSLAAKLEPTIIFIDEIDSFLRERSSGDHEMTASIKAEFMTLWDGLTSDSRIMVLGATNRPNDIDKAILRRMPKRFAVSLPKAPERRRILDLLLKSTRLEPDFDWDFVISQSAGLSGSDLKELCREAAMKAMREYVRHNFQNGKRVAGHGSVIRPLRTTDFFGNSASAELLPGNFVPE